MKNIKTEQGRRKFFRSGSILLGSVLIPFHFLEKKAILGSSISIPISYNGKSLGVKVTIVNGEYLIGTIRIPKSRKLVHFYIDGPSKLGKSTSYKDVKIKLGRDIAGTVTAHSKSASFTTTLKGATIGRVKFNNSTNDDIPSSEGFFNWLKDKVADIGRAVSAGLTFIYDGTGLWFLSDGSTIEVGPGIKYSQNGSGFKAEPGLEESPGVWY